MISIKNTATAYRPEIDGLRAIAVMAVLLFHVDLSWVTGGYIGVDVFFVISGYLISRNIIESLDRQRFTFKAFYLRRFRRLFPALVTTILLASCIAPAILLPEHLERFGWEAVSSFFSISNIYFWSQSGYFDLDADLKPLLHTWSLSIEEQFYLVWPAFLVLMSRINSRVAYCCLITTLGFVSLLAAEYFISIGKTNSAFYLLPFRVIEFVIGMSAVLIEREFSGRVFPEGSNTAEFASSILTATGLSLIVYACLNYTNETPFPGVSALWPCLGTAMVILSGRNIVAKIVLHNHAATFLGKISYSIYLVHWPLIVFYKYRTTGALDAREQWVIVMVTIVLAYLMWRYVEQAFRFSQPASQAISRAKSAFSRRKLDISMAPFVSITAACALTLSVSFIVTKGTFIGGVKMTHLSAEDVTRGKKDRYKLLNTSCKIENIEGKFCHMERPIQALTFGDSHEPDGYNIWRTAYGDNPSLNIIRFGMNNHCVKYYLAEEKHHSDSTRCFERIAGLRTPEIVNKLDMVIYSSNKPFSKSKNEDYNLFAAMKKVNPDLRIIILGGYLNTSKDCSYIYGLMGNSSHCGRGDFLVYGPDKERAEFNKWKKRPFNEMLSPKIIDKFSLLCVTEGKCETSAAGKPFTYDKHHLSFEFAQHIAEKIRQIYGDTMLADG